MTDSTALTDSFRYNPAMHLDVVEAAAGQGCPDFAIALALGVDQRTFMNLRVQFPEMDEAVIRGRTRHLQVAEPFLVASLYNAATRKGRESVKAATFLLTNLDPEKYKERRTTEISNSSTDEFVKALRDKIALIKESRNETIIQINKDIPAEKNTQDEINVGSIPPKNRPGLSPSGGTALHTDPEISEPKISDPKKIENLKISDPKIPDFFDKERVT